MSVVLGVDVGGSTTKIVAAGEDRKILGKLQVRADDQRTSLFGAVGHLLYCMGKTLGDVSSMMLTGVGAARVQGDVFGIPTVRTAEFGAIGRGGLLLSGEKEALVVSLGTGAAFVRADAAGTEHIGGSGIGGGTLMGLASLLLHLHDMDAILALAARGRTSQVDLTIGDISEERIPTLSPDITASNFGFLKSTATREDLAAGIIRLVVQNAGVQAALACRSCGLQTVTAVGSLATLPQTPSILQAVGELYRLRFIVPENAAFATAIGAALASARNTAI